MKNKPLRHKESNTFKFQPFSERIANIDVDVFHRVGHLNEIDEDGENVTYFYKTLQKCNDLNLSKSYESLKKNIGRHIETLPQLLTQKNRIVTVLSQCLEEADPLSLQSCLELVVALAQDLRQEFYPFYPELLKKILIILNIRDPDQLEWAFTCLAYLFKHLWKFLVKDLSTVFDQLVPLLSSSKPHYVNNFAAESFAFVARKVRDKKNFLKLILKTLKKTNDGISGCGRLLFEVLNGVQGQFHTCAQIWLPFLLESLSDHGLPLKLLVEVLTQTFSSIATTISAKHSKVLWDFLQQYLSKWANEWSNNKNEEICESVTYLLQLISIVLQQKQCALLLNPVEFVSTFTRVISLGVWPPQVTMLMVDISSSILLSPRIRLPQDLTVLLIQKVTSSGDWPSLKQFVNRMLSYSGFEIHILPCFLQICQEKDFQDVLLQLTKIALVKTPPAKSFSDLKNKYIYPLHSSFHWKEELCVKLMQILDIKTIEDIENNKEDLICCLIVLPNVIVESSTFAAKAKSALSNLISLIVLECSVKKEYLASNLFLLHQAISAIFLLCGKKTTDLNLTSVLNILLALSKTHILALQVLEIYVNICKRETYEPVLVVMKADLAENLASPFHQVRWLSASLLRHLEQDNAGSDMHGLLSAIVSAESISASVHEYRDKLRYLQMLECTEAHERQANFKIPLNYLLGNLYVNFKLLWEPVSKLIVSYAKMVSASQFWPIFVSQLNLAVQQVEKGISTGDSHNYKYEILVEASKSQTLCEDRPDVFNQRILLWQVMTNFPEVCEEKNRDISILFLNFLKTEYYRISADEATSWNIKQVNRKSDEKADINGKDSENENNDKDMDVENEENKLNDSQNYDDEDEEETPSDENTSPGRTASKSLLAHLTLFGRLRNPRSMYREPELSQAYHDLLSHKNPNIQRAALDCIATYKFKYLLPYKDHLYGLIEDKTFKEEVTLFRIDTDNDVIRPEHREELIPIVMRIVYSKMLNRSGVRTGSKSAKQARRSIVFRFLAGCKPEELLFYLRMAFRLYASTVQDDSAAMVASIESGLDLTRMTPPKRLLSTANLLSVVLGQCGSLLSTDALRFLLRVLLCVGATTAAALAQRHLVHAPYINALRNIRNTSLNVLTKFFTSFETFPWTKEEIDTVFEVFVWPYLSKLPVEGIHSPTSLLKLFMTWSQVPRYFPFLIKFKRSSPDLTPLPFIMSLLVSTKSHGSVVSAIMDMVEKILTWEESIADDESPPPPLSINDLLPVDAYHIKGDVSFGSKILYPHIPSVLERMKLRLSKPKSFVGQRDLTILSYITVLVHDSVTSDTLLSLLLPVIGRKAGASENVICPLITTVTNLIRNVAEPHSYIRSLAPLFGSVAGAEPRRMLSALVKSIDRKEKGLNAKLLEDLNAWNAKWLDQPDFDRRLDAFKEIQKMNTSGQITVEQGVIIIYTCFHFIRVEKDMSLRDSASQCLHDVCPSLCKQYPAEQDFLVNKTILGLIAAGIKDKKSEPIQQESITLLGFMARECADLHPVLRDLSLLGNKKDPEVDFFENLQHLQLHRKVRALLKICEVSKGLVKLPNTRTLTQFVLPIVSHFLYSERYINKNTIVDAAIEVLGTVCKLLPWHHYELVLRFYLGKLRYSVEFQKQLVRVVVAILNAFHFDLSNADLKEVNSLNKVKEIKDNAIKEKPIDKCDDNDDEESTTVVNGDDDMENKDKIEETLDDILNKEDVADGLCDEISLDHVEVVQELVLDKQTKLSKSMATRVVYTIRTILLPQLHRIITARTQSDAMHKVNRKFTGPDRDEEDILRVPIALAAVKLLQRLPEEVLEQNISGILMKLSTYLKSRLESVRRVTRETLQKVVVSLGAKYLPLLIQEMTAALTQGFLAHVLVYSIHSVLVASKPLLQSGDLDPCVYLVIQACKTDLFGKSAEEKEVKQIAGNLMEARANRSYDIFHILAEFTTQKCLLDLIIPLKEELGLTLSHKAVNKGRECLRHIVLGLVDNKFVTTEALLIFAYGTASESIPALFTGVKKDLPKEKPKQKHLEERVDTFLIPAAPKSRPSVQSKISARTNAHIFVEFGLTLYHFLLKREKIKGVVYRPHMDPLVKVLADCLKSEHVKISTLSLQCLCWVLKFDLPALRANIEDITQWVFTLLHKYASAGLSKGDNFDLVMAAFKVVAVVVRDVKYHQLSKEQQRSLILYCEQDIHNYSRQAIAFSLLKAILGRKLQLPELNAVMEKVSKISITADIDNVRLQARQVFHQYLMEYAMGKKFEKHLTWYLQQLEYDLQPGRESALEMIKTLINTLPSNVLKEQSGFMFVTIAARLVNDDVPACRKMAAEIIAQLLSKVDNNMRESLFDIVLLWMQDKKVLHCRLGVQLCGLFAEHDGTNFRQRLKAVLPLIVTQIKHEMKDLKPHVQVDEVNSKDQQRDHHLYQILHLLVKVSTICPSLLTDNTHLKNVQFLAESAQTLLAYPHEWVRLGATQFIGKVLGVLTPIQVAEAANSDDTQKEGYLFKDTRHTLRTLILDLCSQLTPGIELNDKLLMQTMKNLIFLAEVLQLIQNEHKDSGLTLQWLIRRIRKIIHFEIIQAPSFTVLRTMCFNWMAALVVKLEPVTLQPLLPLIMAPIVRELCMPENEDSSLKKVAKEVANFVKKRIGSEEYNRLLNSLTTKLQVRRAERKKEKAQLVVREPEIAAKRKISKQLKKKSQKKKKIEAVKKGKFKRKKNSNRNNEFEVS